MHEARDIKALARLMDDQFKGPFGFRFGMDGLLGMIPGIGDVLTNLVSFYILVRAALAGYPISVLLRMAFNILIENIIDWIPLAGNIFDFYWKANRKNIEIIEAYGNAPQRVRLRSLLLVLAVIVLALSFTVGTMLASIAILVKLGSYIVGHIAI